MAPPILGFTITPSPFRPDGRIRISVGADVEVRVRILDFTVRTVRTLAPETAAPSAGDGFHALDSGTRDYFYYWDGKSDAGQDLAQRAVYFIVIHYKDADGNIKLFETRASGLVRPQTSIFDEPEDADVFTDQGDLKPGIGMTNGSYLICHTYASVDHGIETPPSPFTQSYISSAIGDGRATAYMTFSGYLNEVPAWADQVRFYVKKAEVPDDVNEPKDVPYDFTYVGGVGREDLEDDFDDTHRWANEYRDTPFNYLRSKEYETSPDHQGITHVITYAGRVWAYDRNLHVIRFSHIERPDVMPYDEARIPHAIRIDGSWQARVEALHVMPVANGGIYVFFPRAIRTIRGQQIVTGLYTIEVSPETDVDATGGINGKGTRSPFSIVDFGALTFYLDTDRRVYSLSGEGVLNTEEFSLSIQPFLDQATDAEIRAARGVIWQSRYHLMIGDKTFILDLQRNYWTVWDVEITSIIHSVGGDYDEDVLYAIVSDAVVELYSDDPPDDIEWMWVTNFVELSQSTVISEVVLPHPEPAPPKVEMMVETERGELEWKEYEPSAGNFYRLGTFARTDIRARVHIRGIGEIPRFNALTIGVSGGISRA